MFTFMAVTMFSAAYQTSFAGIQDYGKQAGIEQIAQRQINSDYLNELRSNTLMADKAVDLGVMPSQYIVAETPNISKTELRGVWLTNIDSDVLFERDRLTAALQRLNQLNFNTVYPTVWNWGYTLYPSAVAQKEIGRSLDPEPRLKGRDILREIVTSGHQKGMGVIPWFEFGFMAPADSQLALRHQIGSQVAVTVTKFGKKASTNEFG